MRGARRAQPCDGFAADDATTMQAVHEMYKGVKLEVMLGYLNEGRNG